jgi:vanillate O-demethylase monooxygenase subunit
MPVVESQRPEELPEDLSYELHLKGVDTFHLQYRRWLLELSKELVED